MEKAVGVLALQGDFREHVLLLHSMGAGATEVRNRADLERCSALIIPGGESTTMSKLMHGSGLDVEITKRVKNGMPLYGTCAGAIVIARKVAGEKRFRPLGLIDIEVARNAYGRQVDSFESEVEVKAMHRGRGAGRRGDIAVGAGPAGQVKIKGVFIRAPVIKKAGRGVEVLATLDKRPVLVRQGNVIAGTFHPEIAGETAVHKLLVGIR